jgi:conjugative transfer signal peptidase TraF
MKTGARHLRRHKFLPLLLALIILLLALSLRIHGYGLTYQTTDSMPKGLYVIKPAHHLKRNDIVIFYPPAFALAFLMQQKLIPKNAILMKSVMAVEGDYICKKNQKLWINHRYIAPVYAHTLTNKRLPNKKFCQTLHANQYLLISTYVAHSFDGRYFGPVSKSRIIGKAIKV